MSKTNATNTPRPRAPARAALVAIIGCSAVVMGGAFVFAALRPLDKRPSPAVERPATPLPDQGARVAAEEPTRRLDPAPVPRKAAKGDTHDSVSPEDPFPEESDPNTTPLGMRQAVERRLRASGAAGTWSASAPAIIGNWAAQAPSALAQSVKADPVQCFGSGCFTTVTTPSLEALQEFERSFTTSDAFANWPGPKHRTAPDLQKDGTVLSAWVFLPPGFFENQATASR
jgi:hypothetical protein